MLFSQIPFPSLIKRLPIVKVVFKVPNKTISTIVLTPLGDTKIKIKLFYIKLNETANKKCYFTSFAW